MNIPIHTLEDYCRVNNKPHLPFSIESLQHTFPELRKDIHLHNYFQIVFLDRGCVSHTIEDRNYTMEENCISVVFPNQIHQMDIRKGSKGKVIAFDEVLFCSDILKKELSAYNVDLYKKLNFIKLSGDKYGKASEVTDNIQYLYNNITPIKKEQIRFYIKILLLQLIEEVHSNILPVKKLTEVNLYAGFKELIDKQYARVKTVSEYALLLGVSTKKLNGVCKKKENKTALSVIHERIMVEVKRMLLFSGETNKEIAYKLGFTSPSALSKFIYSKTNKTPTELKRQLGSK